MILHADIASEMLLLDEISQHWQLIFPGRVLVVPYERVVMDLESAAREMLSHCNLPWDDNVLQFHQNQRTVQTASLAQVPFCCCCCWNLLVLLLLPLLLLLS